MTQVFVETPDGSGNQGLSGKPRQPRLIHYLEPFVLGICLLEWIHYAGST